MWLEYFVVKTKSPRHTWKAFPSNRKSAITYSSDPAYSIRFPLLRWDNSTSVSHTIPEKKEVRAWSSSAVWIFCTSEARNMVRAEKNIVRKSPLLCGGAPLCHPIDYWASETRNCDELMTNLKYCAQGICTGNNMTENLWPEINWCKRKMHLPLIVAPIFHAIPLRQPKGILSSRIARKISRRYGIR
jgi:hypothetical protein